MTDLPAWLRQARDKWEYRGQARPAFAQPPGPGQESVWDYPRPPRIERDQREVVVRWNETEIANSRRARRVLETASPPAFYLAPQDVRVDLLVAAPGNSLCEWKGQASYWSVRLPEGPRLTAAAWSYRQPFEGFEEIAGFFAFYPALLTCSVEGSPVEPQPGDLYGGWVTPELVGPFKGLPGTAHW